MSAPDPTYMREVAAALCMPEHRSDLTDDAAALLIDAAEVIERVRAAVVSVSEPSFVDGSNL